MKNRTVLLYMTFVFLSNFSTILYFLTVYLEFVGFSMVAISSMMIAYQVSKFILEVPTGYIADRFGRKTSGLVGVVGMLGYYAALLLVRSPLLLIGAFALKGFAVACLSGSIEAIYIDSVSQDQLVRLILDFSKCCRFFDALFTDFGPKPDGGGGCHPFLSVQCCVEQHRGYSSHIACSARDIFFGVYPRAISSYKSKAVSIWAPITYISTQ